MLCYSTGSLPDNFSFSEILNVLGPTPFRGIELVITPEMLKRADDKNYWLSIRSDFESRGLCFRNIHLGAPLLLGPRPHHPGLSSLVPHEQARKLEAAEKATYIGALLGSPHITLTTGLPDSEVEINQHVQALKKVLEILIKNKPKGLVYLIEQEPEHVIRSTQQLLALGQEYAGDIFANFDLGHSQVLGEDIAASIRELDSLLLNIHLEDIKDRVHNHKLFGDGDIDFPSIFSAIRAINFHGDFTPDLYPFKDDYTKAIEASAAFLGEHGVLT